MLRIALEIANLFGNTNYFVDTSKRSLKSANIGSSEKHLVIAYHGADSSFCIKSCPNFRQSMFVCSTTPTHTHWCRINGCLVRLVTHSRIISETSSYSKSACDLFYCTWIGRECVFTNLLPMCSHRCHSHDFNLESRWGFGIHNFPKCYDDHFQCVLASKQHIYPRVKRVKMNFLAMVFVVNHILSWPILGQSVKDISIHFFLSG